MFVRVSITPLIWSCLFDPVPEDWSKFAPGFFQYPYFSSNPVYVVRCTIWYHLYNLKNVKNTHGRVLIKLTLLHGCFSRFWNCTNGTKSHNASHIQDLSLVWNWKWYWHETLIKDLALQIKYDNVKKSRQWYHGNKARFYFWIFYNPEPSDGLIPAEYHTYHQISKFVSL